MIWLALIFLAVTSAWLTYSTNHYYKEAHRMRDQGAREALSHFLLRMELQELHRGLGVNGADAIESTFGEDYVAGYVASTTNARHTLGQIINAHDTRKAKAAAAVGDANAY